MAMTSDNPPGSPQPGGPGGLSQPPTAEVDTRQPGPSGQGRTTIAESVVAKIAALSAREVAGVDSLGGILSGALSGVVGRIRGDEHRTTGVGVEVGTKQAAIDLSLTVRYPYPIHEVAEAVRQNVIDRIEGMTGLAVIEVNIAVVDLAFDTSGPDAPGGGSVRVE